MPDAGVNLFIAAYLAFAWLWGLDNRSPLRRLAAPIEKPVKWLGLWHSWNMFVPDPSRTNRYIEAEIRLASGAVVTWRALRLSELDRFSAFLSKRHRKYQLNLVRNHYHVIRPALCDYLASRFGSPDDPATEVTLFHFFYEVPEPGGLMPAAPLFARTVLHRRDVGAGAAKRSAPALRDR